jgi:hypothetical protein
MRPHSGGPARETSPMECQSLFRMAGFWLCQLIASLQLISQSEFPHNLLFGIA